ATIGLCVLNVILFFVVPPVTHEHESTDEGNVVEQTQEETNFERYALRLGDGRLHPVQWVTHNFLNLGFLDLAGNMLFLWSFGIVIEGKLGALKYLPAYLAMGTLHGAMMQLILLRSGLDMPAAGASAMIYGLLAACMIWAPRNELNCTAIFFVGLRTLVYQWDLRYTTVALLYVGEQALGLVFWGSIEEKIMVTELGNLSGAFWGTVVAIVLLKAGLVDCEGWDVFSLWTKNRQLARDWKKRGELLDRSNQSVRKSRKGRGKTRATGEGEESPAAAEGEDRRSVALRKVRRLIDKGDTNAAADAYSKAGQTLFGWPPSQPELLELIKAFHAQGAEVASIRLMRDHCEHYPRESSRMSLKLAQVLLRDCQRPAAARKVLQNIPAGLLAGDLEKARRKLLNQAVQMIEEGVLEVEGDD
ncbi:MAG: rhomboid family intramembrane serine protease, partial [Isosphaeraceae bacterium]